MTGNARGVLAIVVALFLTVTLGCSRRESPDRTASPENSKEVSMQEGWAFETALQKLSIPQEVSSSIIASLKDTFDFRRCIPGDRAVLVTGDDGEFKRFEYYRSPTTYFSVEPSDSGMVAREIALVTEKKVYFLEGSIHSSLYESVIELGEGPELAFLLSDIFAWDIDFNVETRTNDRFSVLALKEYLNGKFLRYGPILYATYSGSVGDHEATRFEDSKGHANYYDKNGKALKKVFLRSALQYRRISSYFSKRRFHPILKQYCPHHGVDYAAPVGTPVSAIGEGVVTFAGRKGSYGKLIYIKHKGGFKSGYGHLSRFAKGIKRGRRVRQGQLIGYVGTTGRTTGPHLHFEMKRWGNFVNPLRVRIPAADPVSKKQMSRFKKNRANIQALAKACNLMETTRELANIGRDAAKATERYSSSAPDTE